MALIDNKKAYFDYDITQKYEAGIELLGFEVKSLKKGQGSLLGSYVIIRGDEAFVMNLQIPPFQPSNTPSDYNPERSRKLLLSKKEIKELKEIEKQKGLTIVPIMVYNKARKLKIEIGVARGKKRFDKRNTIKERETDIEIRREFKR
jgi:SsrA-binding protein